MTKKAAVLVIEDQPILRIMAVDLVENAGFEALEACGIQDALRILEERDDIRIVFSDIDGRGGEDGLKLMHVIRDRWPPIDFIVVSDRRRVTPHHLPARGLFFDKPYREEQVVEALRRLAA